jgi:hypothetical protein
MMKMDRWQSARVAQELAPKPLNDVVLQNTQISDRVRHAEAVASPDSQRSERMHVFTAHVWNRQLRRARPHINDGQIGTENPRSMLVDPSWKLCRS